MFSFTAVLYFRAKQILLPDFHFSSFVHRNFRIDFDLIIIRLTVLQGIEGFVVFCRFWPVAAGLSRQAGRALSSSLASHSVNPINIFGKCNITSEKFV